MFFGDEGMIQDVWKDSLWGSRRRWWTVGGDIFGYQVRVRVSGSDPHSEGRPHLWNGEAAAPRLFELDESHKECCADGVGTSQEQ